MARIIIIDNNRSAGALLKKALEHELHYVNLADDWRGLKQYLKNQTIDLVLIRQKHQSNSAWLQFNQLKDENKHIPAMIYVLPDYQWTSIEWIVKAVHEVVTPSTTPSIHQHRKPAAHISMKPA
jgi:DNA-binding NtrC family response regulator